MGHASLQMLRPLPLHHRHQAEMAVMTALAMTVSILRLTILHSHDHHLRASHGWLQNADADARCSDTCVMIDCFGNHGEHLTAHHVALFLSPPVCIP